MKNPCGIKQVQYIFVLKHIPLGLSKLNFVQMNDPGCTGSEV